MQADILRDSAKRAGYKRRSDELARILGWTTRKLFRKLADPDEMKIWELRLYARTTGMSADEIVELIRGKDGRREDYGARTLRRSEGHDAAW